MLSIGELSRRTGVKVPTIRYYEMMGLISAPERTEGNQRRYTRQEFERLSFIRHARDLGLSIDAIRDLIALNENPEMPCREAHVIANSHLAQIEARIKRLLSLKKELRRITENCTAEHVGECYVIQSLSDHELCETEH
jgi:DNA-binding transcriptional MerR regulator